MTRAGAGAVLAASVACLPVLIGGGFTGDDFLVVAYGKELAEGRRPPSALLGPFLGVGGA